jgi:hypothetical protein
MRIEFTKKSTAAEREKFARLLVEISEAFHERLARLDAINPAMARAFFNSKLESAKWAFVIWPAGEGGVGMLNIKHLTIAGDVIDTIAGEVIDIDRGDVFVCQVKDYAEAAAAKKDVEGRVKEH